MYVWETQVGHQNPLGVILPLLSPHAWKVLQSIVITRAVKKPHPQSVLEITYKFSQIAIKQYTQSHHP
jgi:hypothetical protein